MNNRARAMLTELADLLDSLPRERFDYGSWVGSDWKGNEDLSCGTTACAAGWATTLPSFREAGLRLLSRTLNVALNVGGDSGCWGTEAMAKVLGISDGESAFLFIPCTIFNGRHAPPSDAYPTEVADHIRSFLEMTQS